MHGTINKAANEEMWGPLPYELGATVAKFRRMASGAGGVMEMDRAMRHAYADAVEKAVRAKHRTLHMKPNPPTTPGWYNPPSVLRLLRYENPIKMADDPDWDTGDRGGCKWAKREKVVYAAAMGRGL